MNHATLGDDDRWLGRVSPETRAFVRAHVRRRICGAGAFVYAEGNPADGLYQVVTGEVRLVSHAASGRRTVALVAKRKHWFGELSVLDGGPRPHDAVCTGPSTLLHLPMHDITTFGRAHPLLFRDVALIGCAHQRAALSFIDTILSKSGQARLCEMLLATASREQTDAHASVAVTQEIWRGASACRGSISPGCSPTLSSAARSRRLTAASICSTKCGSRAWRIERVSDCRKSDTLPARRGVWARLQRSADHGH